jgi:TRAP-type mannitol/chloroaromatic compound transport system substrate-binding protein
MQAIIVTKIHNCLEKFTPINIKLTCYILHFIVKFIFLTIIKRGYMKKIISLFLGIAMFAGFTSTSANAAKTLKCQTVISAKADEVKMLKDWGQDITDLTNGEIKFEILPAGAVVGVKETLDAVDKGLIDCGFAWTHYWSGEHPAAMLFGSPVAGAGVGIDNIAFLSWFQYGGGKELYDQLWKEMKRDIKGFMLQPVGPEALGWFKEPINSMDDFRKYKFRTPPGIPGQTYKDIGVASVAMGGGDILPALEAGTIDAAEWCCPKPDMTFGFQKVLKHYYLQGLHQVVVNADIYINGKVYRSLTPVQKKAFEVASNASLSKSMSYRIYENGKALHELTTKHGVILHDTPADYFPAYMAAAKAALEKNAKKNKFFAKVWQSQKDFADIAVPFWSGAQMSNAKLGMAHAETLK